MPSICEIVGPFCPNLSHPDITPEIREILKDYPETVWLRPDGRVKTIFSSSLDELDTNQILS